VPAAAHNAWADSITAAVESREASQDDVNKISKFVASRQSRVVVAINSKLRRRVATPVITSARWFDNWLPSLSSREVTLSTSAWAWPGRAASNRVTVATAHHAMSSINPRCIVHCLPPVIVDAKHNSVRRTYGIIMQRVGQRNTRLQHTRRLWYALVHTPWSVTKCHLTFVHILAKYWPI